MPNDKVKLTQKEFDDIYEIEGPLEITEESTEVPLSAKPSDDTTPLLNAEEQKIDDEFYDELSPMEDID